jgi:hypothetical protein
MLYAAPGQQIEVTVDGAPTGLEGTLGIQILDTPADDVVVPRTTDGIVEAPPNSGLYGTTIIAPAVEGVYSIVWDTGGASPDYAREQLRVTFVPPGPALITLDEYKRWTGIDPTNTRNDEELTRLILAASRAIRNFTERSFNTDLVLEERTFPYDGSGYLDIDDAVSVNSVVLGVPGWEDQTLDSTTWVAQPSKREDSPVYTYVYMPGVQGNIAGSPEMGFVRNLDVLAREGRVSALPAQVKVTGEWGWPSIPEDVQQAAVWTVQEFKESPEGENVQSEAIESFSHSFARNISALAIPNRARDLLITYQRQRV